MKSFKYLLCVATLAASAVALPARAQSEASLALSALPVASVVASAYAGAAVSVVPVALSVVGATLMVKAVEVTARGTVYLLERASDGAQASVEVVGRAASGAVVGVGTVVAVSAIVTGVLISTAAEVLAFIPNELGRALLYSQRVTD